MSLLTTLYRGHDLLTPMPNGDPIRDQTWRQETEVLDGGVGQWASSWPVDAPELDWPFAIVLDSRDLVSEWLLWLAYRRGRYAPFWMPTWRRDFQLAVSAGSSATELIVYDTGYTGSGFTTEARRHLAVIVAGGGARTIYPRRITASVDNADGTETLTLESTVGVALDRHCVLSHLVLARLDDDTHTVHWHHPNLAIATVRITELPRQMEETA
jgi:hypothetical protein